MDSYELLSMASWSVWRKFLFPHIDSVVYKLTFGILTAITETANNSVFETVNVIKTTRRRELAASRRLYRNYGTKTRIQCFQNYA